MNRLLYILALLAVGCIAFSAIAEPGPQAELPESATAASEVATIDDNSEAMQIDISGLSIDELLALQDRIREELVVKGYNPYYEIERNDKGDEVARLQERLQELGYYTGIISGKYDSSTAQAMKQFEKANGLTNDGKASREDQALLYSDDAMPKAAPTPAPTFSHGDEQDILDIDPSEYGTLDYDTYYRNPENYSGDKVKLIGTVYQVMGNRANGFRLLFSVGGNNVYIVVSDPGYNIMENDRLIIYAHMHGTYTYTSTMHQEITVPFAYADAITLR